MPLPFSSVCDLLEQSYILHVAQKPNTQAVLNWFQRHRNRINANDTSIAALLSTLLPEKRTDRVYCIQEPTLEKIIGRALMLGSSRIAELAIYKKPGLDLDLGDCVERVLVATPNPTHPKNLDVTVEQVDILLHGLASNIKWSSPSVRVSQSTSNHNARDALETLFRRLSPRDAKWFTRLILKSYEPVIFDSHLIYRAYDPIFPFILKIREDFTSALSAIQLAKRSVCPKSRSTVLSPQKLLNDIKPRLGVKVGRQCWLKARSIKHCMDMAKGQVSVEQKIDGEYCQVHVDVRNGSRKIQIFSKSGKDSTEDRKSLFRPIAQSLRLGKPESTIKSGCILEGELVIYSEREHKVLPFHKIRKYVARRGHYMNTELDSQRKPYERVMIIFYDILLLDDESLLNVRQSERFALLEKIIHCQTGVAELVSRQVIDFGHRMGASDLRSAFAKVIVNKGEGLVIRPDEPYIVVDRRGVVTSGRCIKLKKEYIGSFGEVGDFAVVGAGFSSAKAKSYNIPNLKWTHFYIGCLNNKEHVKRWQTTPEFTITNVVELNQTQLQTLLKYADARPVLPRENTSIKLILPSGVDSMANLNTVFSNPPVFDLRCFSFDKPGNIGFWTMRFPSVAKLHFDRDWSDVVTFEEFQIIAKEATSSEDEADSQENLQWIANLEAADPQGIAVDAVSQLTATTMPTPSPRQSTQDYRRHINSQISQSSASYLSQQSIVINASALAHDKDPVVQSPPFATPPTSSDPVTYIGVSPKRKRCSSESSQASNNLGFKRQKDGSKVCPRIPLRLPLADIDANGSQSFNSTCSFTSSVSQNLNSKSQGLQSNIDELRAAQNKDFVVVHKALAVELAPIYEILDSDDDTFSQHHHHGSEMSQQAQRQGVSSARPASSKGMAEMCSLAGESCHFANSTIIFSPSLNVSTELMDLLHIHGIRNVIDNVEEWWSARCKLISPTKNITKKVLLVDSVEQNSQTMALLAKLDLARKEFRREKRDWITVYDWRVLNNLNILENVDVKRKYYDGFQDPWRRWYCGIV